MKKLTALPAWWGIMMMVMAGIFAFPAIGHLTEGHVSEIWDVKVEFKGYLYSLGMLLWSYGSIILSAVFIAVGLQILVTSDKKANQE